MPTYDYVCEACDHKFEAFQSITAKTMRTCPKCHKKKLRRLIGGGAAILFKGSGFYSTDYRSDSYKKAAEADKQPSPESSGGDKSKGDQSSSKGPSKKGNDSTPSNSD